MDSAEYTRIAEKYTDTVYKAVFSYCKNKADAEDAVQNTFLKLLKANISFTDEEHIKRWLIRAAVNECKNMWKSYWRKNSVSLEVLEESGVYAASEEGGISDSCDLARQILSLPQKYSLVIHLYYYEGYSSGEIAQIMSISEANVHTRLNRGRKKLKEILEEADS